MPLKDADFRSLRKVLSPLLRDTNQRQYWLNEAFPTTPRLRNIFTLDNLDPDAFTQKLLLYLYEQDSALLIVFVQVIQEEQGGDLGRTLQPFIDKLNAPAKSIPQPAPARTNTDLSNDVFISYRRDAAQYIALAVWQDLHGNGINAFYDIESINAGQFDSIILNQIAARPYFMPILTPGTLDRCLNDGDWVRREIEHAVALKRILVPLRTPDFKLVDLDKFLPATLAAEVKRYNMMEVPPSFFKFALQKVREDFLKPVRLPVTPPPAAEVKAVERKLAALVAQAPVTEKQLSAQEYFARGIERLKTGDNDGAIADNSDAIRLNPQFVDAYVNRGNARLNQGDNDGAIADYNEAIRLNPQEATAYYNRGTARDDKGDNDGAIADYTEAIRLNPKYAIAYNNRGIVRVNKGDNDGAIADYTEAIRLNPKYAIAYNNRGTARLNKGDNDGAIADYTEAIRLNPKYAMAYYNRGHARHDKGDNDGAIADYTEAIRLNPKYAMAYYNRGFARRKKGDQRGAEQDYAEAIRLGYKK